MIPAMSERIRITLSMLTAECEKRKVFLRNDTKKVWHEYLMVCSAENICIVDGI